MIEKFSKDKLQNNNFTDDENEEIEQICNEEVIIQMRELHEKDEPFESF